MILITLTKSYVLSSLSTFISVVSSHLTVLHSLSHILPVILLHGAEQKHKWRTQVYITLVIQQSNSLSTLQQAVLTAWVTVSRAKLLEETGEG
ncbi:hypothetical protein BDR06DRAFT_244865 [Suillus hirtellus]|nr:hypothetical protein BDR06DRAFT_244865 [Suillus hirtellus]